MKHVMFTLDEVKNKIQEGRKLFLAADESAMIQLPKGDWIGGTIPYFMTEKGGELNQEKLYVTELPEYVSQCSICLYHEENLDKIYSDIPENGVGLIIMPASSNAHLSFALNAHDFDGFATRPLIGWITGVHLDQLGKITPKIFSGTADKNYYEDGALVMHFALPDTKIAEINIINIFEPGDGDVITFPHDDFSAKEAFINGEKRNFAEYLLENNLDIRLPLVADYAGALINTSFQKVDQEEKRVSFYAPVFRGIEYKHAKPIDDYVEKFLAQLSQVDAKSIFFSCNCILNYLYSELEGKKTGEVTGPMTFGEVAYQLLNQTLVYLSISDLS